MMNKLSSSYFHLQRNKNNLTQQLIDFRYTKKLNHNNTLRYSFNRLNSSTSNNTSIAIIKKTANALHIPANINQQRNIRQ